MNLPPLYKLWDNGTKLPKYNSRDIYLVGIQAYAKEHADFAPHEFSNEYICGLLAQAIGLPVAQGIFVDRNGVPCYASFNSYMSGTQLPPCVPPVAQEIVLTFPDIACGIVLFDLWVNNDDRHKGNVGYDRDKKTIHIFDHGSALMGEVFDPVDHMQRKMEYVGMEGHCIRPHMSPAAWVFIDEWETRIKAVPNDYIRRIIKESERFGTTPEIREVAFKFLTIRRGRLKQLLDDNSARFPNYKGRLGGGK